LCLPTPRPMLRLRREAAPPGSRPPESSPKCAPQAAQLDEILLILLRDLEGCMLRI